MEQKHEMSMRDMGILGVVVAVLICLEIYILSLLGLPVWPASFALIFFFEGHLAKDNIKNILVGGSVGLIVVQGVLALVPKVTVWLLPLFKPDLAALAPDKIQAAMTVAAGNAALMGIICMVFIFLVVFIGLMEKYHIVFNNYAIGFFTIAMWNLTEFLHKVVKFELLPLLGVTIIGGGLLIAGTVYAMKVFRIGQSVSAPDIEA
jgi:hypothetical protein